jgi:hypothetical protein
MTENIGTIRYQKQDVSMVAVPTNQPSWILVTFLNNSRKKNKSRKEVTFMAQNE